jgi:glycine cleavage system regulatory protein
MQRSLVMTIIGEDRPGLVESVANLVAKHGGNWLKSRMSHLGGQFAGILRVEVPEEKEQSLLDALKTLDAQGLNVIVHADKPKPAAAKRPLSVLEIIGQDRPGIIRDISHALATYGVNVEELHTECVSAAMSGETLFKARATLNIPESCNLQELLKTLEKIAADLFVVVSLEKDALP